ncbi:molybdate ABC transporter substrate-binding protein [Paeniglutamicibacter gangotriensis]|uniref:Molybdate ABC transporter substrate-binding protein n=1 Tax=Paeniglutamicibacter gangotriensis TaxID=254787 RepID=A0A5B0EKI3_9MICC|nr:molybdate ABC transporter substrate-binding protein [Paeniglutamicibacter gangotriensis]KAA0979246.1 molybdate ABC transporter substrate-binding protein [Paeniglutamicibacter gangotriensis]
MNRLGRSAAALFICAALTVSLASCAAETNTPDTSISGPTGEITVFAAASLNGPFTELAADFEAQHPGTEIKLSFAGSSDLVTQIIAGAPADVFASADERNMTKLADADLVAGTPIDFATNTLQIVVPPANPAEVSSLADLTKPELKVVICAPQVPCGAATKTIEEAARLVLTPVSEESSVTDVLGKVRSGEADAGLVYVTDVLVYVTDVLAAGDQVKGIEFPESSAAVNSYPIATVGTSSNQKLADAFIASVTGPEGQKMLSAAGFGTPRS